MPDKKKKYPQWIYTVNIVLWSLVLIGIVGGLILEREEKNGFVSKEMYGDKWPLTVDSGTLSCVSAENLNDHLYDYKTYFTTGENTYIIWNEKEMNKYMKGKKMKYPFMTDLGIKTDEFRIKSVNFLEIKAKSLCKEFDKDGNTRYKILPAWQRKERDKQGLPVYVLK